MNSLRVTPISTQVNFDYRHEPWFEVRPIVEPEWSERCLTRIQKKANFPQQWVEDNLYFASDFFSDLRDEFPDSPEQAAEVLLATWQDDGDFQR